MKTKSNIRSSFIPHASLKSSAVLVALAALSAASPELVAQTKMIPTGPVVRSAGSARMPAQTVQIATSRDYWIGKAHDGSTMGVWAESCPDGGLKTIKFVIGADSLCAIASQEDAHGTPVASSYNLVFLDKDKPKANTPVAVTHSVGPEDRQHLRDYGAFPVKLPAGLEKGLVQAGVEARQAKQLKALVEAQNALDAIAGAAAFGNQSMPTGAMSHAESGTFAVIDPSLKRPTQPGEMRQSPTAGLPGRDGRASEDDKVKPKSPQEESGQGRNDNGSQAQGESGTVKKDLVELDSQEAGSRQGQQNHRANGGSASPSTGSTPSSGAPRTDANWTPVVTKDTIVVFYPVVNPQTHAVERNYFKVPRAGTGSGPNRRNTPSEGGGSGSGIDTQTWNMVRHTGLGQYLYNNWLQKKNLNFPSLVRQPSPDGQVGKPTREVPKLGRIAVVNPSENGRGLRSQPKLPDMKDPGPDSNGNVGTKPLPIPHP